MGECKTAMTPTTEKAKSLFGRIASKKKKSDSKQDVAKSFCDQLAELDETLTKLITTKEAELKAEKGREEYNQLALSKLKSINFHIESAVEIAEGYTN